MDWFTFVLLAFATYRVTRFTQLDTMFEDTRDIVVHWLAERRKRIAVPDQRTSWRSWRWMKLRHLIYRKLVDGITCAFCVSFWVAVGWLAFWAGVSDYDIAWPLVLHAFAVAGASMLVYRIVDPPEPGQ